MGEPRRLVHFSGSLFWPITATVSLFGPLSLIGTVFAPLQQVPGPVGSWVAEASLYLFGASVLSSLIGVPTMLLTNFKTGGELTIFGRTFSRMTTASIICLSYFAPLAGVAVLIASIGRRF